MIRLFAFILMIGMCAAARADSFTYDVTFNAVAGSAAGSGYVTFNGTLGSGVQTFTAADIATLDFNVGGYDFRGLGPGTTTSFTFDNGILTGITYTPVRTQGTPGLAIAGLGYTLTATGPSPQAVTTGNITGALAPTPEPNSLWLLGTGMVGVAGLARKRFFGRSAAEKSAASFA